MSTRSGGWSFGVSSRCSWRTASLSLSERNPPLFVLSRLLVESAGSSRGTRAHCGFTCVFPRSFSPVVRSRDPNSSPASVPQVPVRPHVEYKPVPMRTSDGYRGQVPHTTRAFLFLLDGRRHWNAPATSSLKVNRSEIYRWQIYSKQECNHGLGGWMWPSSLRTGSLLSRQPRGLQGCMEEAWQRCQHGSINL